MRTALDPMTTLIALIAPASILFSAAVLTLVRDPFNAVAWAIALFGALGFLLGADSL